MLVLASGYTEHGGSRCDVMVDMTARNDFPGCGGALAPCATIRAGVREAHTASRANVVCIRDGVYNNQCAHGGIPISKTMTIKAFRLGTSPEAAGVVVDCGQQGPAFSFNPTDQNNGMLHLIGISVVNGLSLSSGAGVTATRGRLVVDHCNFKNCVSLANGDMGGDVFYQAGRGALFARNMLSVDIFGSNFTSCAAPNGAGGAILVILEEAALALEQREISNPMLPPPAARRVLHRQHRGKVRRLSPGKNYHRKHQKLAGDAGTNVTPVLSKIRHAATTTTTATTTTASIATISTTSTSVSNIRGALVRWFNISRCQFQDSRAGFAGGAVALVSNESITSDVNWRVEATTITNSTVQNSQGAGVFGGGMHVGFAGQAQRVNVTFQSCNITHSLLNCTGGGECLVGGGGANVRYGMAATDIHTHAAGEFAIFMVHPRPVPFYALCFVLRLVAYFVMVPFYT